MSDHCFRCQRWFFNIAQHEQMSSKHNICHECDMDFTTWIGLKEHWVQSPRHDYCQYCNQHFGSLQELEVHYDSQHHYCRVCNQVFENEYGLSEHYRQSPRHSTRCHECQREFQNMNNLQAHLNSSIHKPKTVGCPFHGCGRSFVSTSALVLHLEGGKCSSRVTRQQVNRYVRQVDSQNVITNPARLLTGGSEQEDTKWIATDATWNGRGYECYLCHHTFGSLMSLNAHLASPRHQDKIYICPPTTCRLQFSTLSALCQHIESERCGVSKFQQVRETMDKISNIGRLTYC